MFCHLSIGASANGDGDAGEHRACCYVTATSPYRTRRPAGVRRCARFAGRQLGGHSSLTVWVWGRRPPRRAFCIYHARIPVPTPHPTTTAPTLCPSHAPRRYSLYRMCYARPYPLLLTCVGGRGLPGTGAGRRTTAGVLAATLPTYCLAFLPHHPVVTPSRRADTCPILLAYGIPGHRRTTAAGHPANIGGLSKNAVRRVADGRGEHGRGA